VLIATGAVAMYAAHRAERLSEKVKKGPTTLPDMLLEKSVDDSSMVVVIAVHVRNATLASQLAGKRVRVCVKYGQPKGSVRCETMEVSVPVPELPVASAFVGRKPQARPRIGVNFGSTCLFLAHKQFESVIRVRLDEVRLGGRTLAKAEMPLVPPWSHLEETELDLQGVGAYRGRSLGQLGLSVEVRAITKGSLRRCVKMLRAERQGGALLTGATQVSEGILVNTDAAQDDEEVPPVVRGRACTEETSRGVPDREAGRFGFGRRRGLGRE